MGAIIRCYPEDLLTDTLTQDELAICKVFAEPLIQSILQSNNSTIELIWKDNTKEIIPSGTNNIERYLNMVHKFQDSLKVGNKGEALLDKHFSKKFHITEVDRETQMLGVDRIFEHKEKEHRCSVEYKTDAREADTGNVFIEIWSNKEAGKRGWAYTSLAQWLYFYLPGSNECCVIEMTALKQQLAYWRDTYRRVTVRNPNYTTIGIVVPSAIFKEVCYDIIKIQTPTTKKRVSK